MLTSMQKLPKLALPMLSAMLLLSLSGDPSPAETSARLMSKPAPGRAVETITPAVTVVATAHYQIALALNCYSNTQCQVDLPAVPARRRLNLTRMSCWMQTSTYSTFALGQLDLRSGDTPLTLVQVLPVDYSTQWGYHMLNRAIDVQIPARHHIRILLSLASGGQAHAAACTAHGTMETLR